MSFEAKCPYCGAKYEATEQDMNRNFSCEICGKDFVVQSVGDTQARPTPQTGSQGKVVIKPRRNTAKGRAVSMKPPQTAESSRPPFRVLHEPVTPLSQKLPSQTQERKLFDVFVDVFIDVYEAAVNWFRNSLWPCILIVAIVPTVFWLHYVNHLRKGEASAICPICWFTGSEEFKAARQIRQKQKEIDALKARRAELEAVPSFVGTRDLVDVFTQEIIPDEECLYEYSGDSLKILQIFSSPKGVRVKHKKYEFDREIFIEMDPYNLVDGETLPPIKVQYVGTLKYETVLHTERRIRSFKAVSEYKLSPKAKIQSPAPDDY